MILTPYVFGAPAGWRTVIDWTGSAVGSSPGWNGYTLRQRFAASILGGSGTKLRITVKAGVGGTLSKAYVQLGATSGDNYDFSTTPVQIFWDAGSASATIGNNVAKLSDECNLTFDGSIALLFSFYFSTMGNIYPQTALTNRTSSTEFYKSGDDATTVNASGYTATNAAFINKLELYA